MFLLQLLLAQRVFSAAIVGTDESSDEGCPICDLEMVPRPWHIPLSCMHKFHTGCISRWAKIATSCPLCRADTPAASVLKARYAQDLILSGETKGRDMLQEALREGCDDHEAARIMTSLLSIKAHNVVSGTLTDIRLTGIANFDDLRQVIAREISVPKFLVTLMTSRALRTYPEGSLIKYMVSDCGLMDLLVLLEDSPIPFTITVNNCDSLSNVKSQIQAKFGLPVSRQQIRFSGRILADSVKLKDAINDGATISVNDTNPGEDRRDEGLSFDTDASRYMSVADIKREIDAATGIPSYLIHLVQNGEDLQDEYLAAGNLKYFTCDCGFIEVRLIVKLDQQIGGTSHFSMTVSTCDSIQNIKAKIEMFSGIAIRDQIVSVNGGPTFDDDSKLLKDYDFDISRKYRSLRQHLFFVETVDELTSGQPQIFIRLERCRTRVIAVRLSTTVSQIKHMWTFHISPRNQCLVFHGVQMEDDKSLAFYGVGKEDTIELDTF